MIKRLLFSILAFVLLFLIWEIALSHSSDFLFVLPTPSAIFRTLFESHSRLLFHATVTLKEMLSGFFLASSMSFPLAWIMHRFKTTRALLQPLFIVIQCLPMFTLAPIMVIWCGWSFTAIVIPTALMIFFPLTLNIYQGLRATPTALLEFFETNQATPLQTFFKLHLPWAVPHIFSGFRIASAIAGIGAIAGEWAGAQEGLGILMLESRRNTDLEMTFAALLVLTAMSFSFYAIILALEKMLSFPRPFRIRRKKMGKLENIMRKKSPIFALFLLLLLLVGCGKQSDKNHFRLLLDWLPNPNHVPLYVAIDRGYFKEEGIDITLQKMHESGGGIAYLTSHQADLLLGHMPSAMRNIAKGAQIKMIGVLIKEPLNCLLYRKDLCISNLSELTGKRLGFCTASQDSLFLDYLLAEKTIQPSEKINVGVDLISAIGTKQVDFLFGTYWNIETAELATLGVDCGYFKTQEFGIPNYSELVILANRSDLRISPDFVCRFQRALQKSLNYCRSFPEEAFVSYLRLNPDKREKNIRWEKKAWEMTYPLLPIDQSVNEEELAQFALWVQKVWGFPKPIAYNLLIN